MVSNKTMLHIHQRLVEIFGRSPDIPFAGISVIFSGDFFQLPPIKACPIYAPYELSSWEKLNTQVENYLNLQSWILL